MLNERNIAFWETISQENIEVLRSKAKSAFFYKYFDACVRFIVLISFIGGVAFISQNGVVTLRTMTGSWAEYGLQVLYTTGQFVLAAGGAFSFGFLIFILCFSFYRDFFGDAYGIIEELTPLSQNKSACSRTLEYMNILECVQYRDTVLANNRELLVIDSILIQNIAEKALQAQLDSQSDYEHELACKKLHGMS